MVPLQALEPVQAVLRCPRGQLLLQGGGRKQTGHRKPILEELAAGGQQESMSPFLSPSWSCSTNSYW